MKSQTTLSLITFATLTAAVMATAAFAEGKDGMKMGGGMGMPVFEEMDADKDGSVTLAEMQAHHDARIKAADTNADGKLSPEELAAMQVQMMSAAMAERAADHATKMVENLDTDADGMLSAEELAAAPGPQKMFDRVDTDGDSAISKAEADAAKEKMSKRGHGGKHGKHGGHNKDDN